MKYEDSIWLEQQPDCPFLIFVIIIIIEVQCELAFSTHFTNAMSNIAEWIRHVFVG